MPPALRNHRTPTAGDTPASTLASSLERPEAIAAQNCLQFSRCASGGRPGDRKAACTHRSGRLYLFIATSLPKCCDDRLNPPWIARSSRATTASTGETSRPEHPGQAGEVYLAPSGNAGFGPGADFPPDDYPVLAPGPGAAAGPPLDQAEAFAKGA